MRLVVSIESCSIERACILRPYVNQLDVVNLLNMTEYWVENHMLDLCEDNDVMRKVLKKSFNKYMATYDMLGGLK